MGVSRLDAPVILNAATSARTSTAAETFTGPCNTLMSFLVSGTFVGTMQIQVFDGTNWVAINGLSITAIGAYSWQGCALGVRANITAYTSGTVTVVAVLADMG